MSLGMVIRYRRHKERAINPFLMAILGTGLFFIFSFVLFRPAHADSINNTDFVTTWKTDNQPGSTSITIPTFNGEVYNYEVDWNNDGVFDQTGITGNVTHDFGVAGTYTVRIRGVFPRIYFNSDYFNNNPDAKKIIDVNQWGTNQWTSMESAFQGASKLISTATDAPDLTKVTDMSWMFQGATIFTGDLSQWNTSSVTNMSRVFNAAYAFNSDLSNWDTSIVTSMAYMFNGAEIFTSDLSRWNISSVTDMSYIFADAYAFNSDLSNWDTGSVIDMSGMFCWTPMLTSDLSGWDTSDVTTMESMFCGETVISDLSGWDVSNVTDTSYMFVANHAFNGDLSHWNTGNVTNMAHMFDEAASFNGDLSRWNTSNVTDMSSMFSDAVSFDNDLSSWDTSSVTSMQYMFRNATSFNQNLGGWNVSSMSSAWGMLDASGLSAVNYDATLKGWAFQPLQFDVALGAEGLVYDTALTARQSVIDNFRWAISGDRYEEGSGRLNITPTVIVNGKPLTQTLVILEKPTFSGLATPGANITVTVHSDPVTCTATADNSGNWSCTLPSSLEVGAHTVYVRVVNPDTSTVDLGPYQVYVVSGKAAVVDDKTVLAPNTGVLQIAKEHAVKQRVRSTLYIAGAAGLAAISTLAVAVVIWRKKRTATGSMHY